MLGNLYDRALDGERCWVRHDDGRVRQLPVRSWLGGHHADRNFDNTVLRLCVGPTIDLGCGPGRLVARLVERGVPALGVDQSATRHLGMAGLRPFPGRWQTVLLADGNVGLGGDPWRMLRRAGELLRRGGSCVVEFDAASTGVNSGWVRLESSRTIGPWFRWASVGIDCAARLADDVGMALTGIHPIGNRVVASLASA